MLNLRSSKGFTLIEVLCSISVFSILFMSALAIQTTSYKIQKYYRKIYTYSLFEEYVKNNIIYNCTYDQIAQLRMQNRLYISGDNINLNNTNSTEFTNIFMNNIPKQKPYIQMNIKGDNVLKIDIKLYTQEMNKKEVMECEVYKGKYKK